jgi:hypothetical protein
LPSVKEPKLSWIPDFETVEFDVDNFSDYVQSKSLICSNPVVLSGNSWRLRIYCQADNSISVYLQQVKGQSKSQSFEYKIEVLGHLSFSRSNTCSFSYPQSWGYSQFCRLQDLEKGGFLVNDTLHMRFHVRHLNWKQRALDLQKYCDSLKMNPDLAKDDEEVGFDENDCAMNHDESMDADHGSASESRVVCADRDEIDQLMMEIFEDSENELKEPELYDQSSSDNEQVQYYESSSESETEQVIFV